MPPRGDQLSRILARNEAPIDPCHDVASSPVDRCELWSARWGQRTAPGSDSAMEIAASQDGSRLYVAGYNNDYQFHGTPFHMRIAVVAYTLREDGEALPEPVQRWTRVEEGPVPGRGVSYPRGVEVSPDGKRVFVAGFSDPEGDGNAADFITLAYDASDGAPLWSSRYDTAGGLDGVEAMAVSPDGQTVYVTGPSAVGPVASSGGGAAYDAVTIAYNAATGTERWRSTFAGRPGGRDYPVSLALSPTGSTVVVGVTSDGAGSGSDLVAVAYDAATGGQRWASSVGGPEPAGADLTAAVAADNEHVYIAGVTQASDRPYDGLIAAFDGDTGVEAWRAAHVGAASGHDAFLDVAARDGAVFASGYETLTDGLADALVVGLDATTGATRWTSRQDGGDGLDDVAGTLAMSPDGQHVFTSGNSMGTETDQDFLTQSFDAATGTIQWSRRFDRAGYGSYEYHFELAATADAVFSTGLSSSSSSDFTTVGYDAGTGDQRWVGGFDGTAHTDDEAAGLAAAPDGSAVYVTGTSTEGVFGGYGKDIATVAYDGRDGRVIWEQRFDGGDNDVAGAVGLDAESGRLFVTGGTQLTPERAGLPVVAYDAQSGAELWSTTLRGPVTAVALSLAVIDGDVVVAGCAHTQPYAEFSPFGCLFEDSDVFVAALDGETGAELWRDVYDGPAHGRDEALDLAVDPASGTIVVTGVSTGTTEDYVTIGYDAASGVRRWLNLYDGDSVPDVATAVDVAGGTAVVTGWSGNAYASLGYDVATGAERFELRTPVGLFSEVLPEVAMSPNGATAYVTLPSLHVGAVSAIDVASGTPRWVARYVGLGISPFANPKSLDATATEVVVVGNAPGLETYLDISFGTVSLDAATGAVRWVAGHDARGGTGFAGAPSDIPVALQIGGSRAFVTGDTGYYLDVLTAAYELS